MLLIALALFVAQAINFELILRERRAAQFSQITVPAITRMVDAAERLRDGRFREAPDRREDHAEDRGRACLRPWP